MVPARPPVAKLRVVGDLLRQWVPEGVLGLRIERLLDQELGLDEAAKRIAEVVGGKGGDAGEERLRELLADDGRSREHGLLPLAEPIDAGSEQRLDRRRDVDVL